MLKNFLAFALELAKVIIISLAIIVPIRYFIIQPFYVKGASMEPNFYDHEYLIIDEISFHLGEPERGQVIVFRYPRNPQEYFIKRVIGLPGEKIKIKDGQVYIYNEENPEGFILPETYLPEEIKTYSSSEEIIALDHDDYFVLGDNRNSSKDSRNFGPVNRSFIIGKVLLRGWPLNRLDFFNNHVYVF